jgi:hypothetical protein
MQNLNWIDLFRLIPESRHNTLVLTTLSGVDLAIETVLRTEQTYLVFRGRVCGQSDDGRIFFLPYRQVDYLQINRSVSEAEIKELLDAPIAALNSEMAVDGQESASGFGPESGFTDDSPSASPAQVVPTSPPVPPAAVRSPAPTRISPPGRASNGAAGGVPSGANGAVAAGPPPASVGTNGNSSPAAAPRNSILERLRAQRNAVVPSRSPQR